MCNEDDRAESESGEKPEVEANAFEEKKTFEPLGI